MAITASITTRSLAKPFSMIGAGTGAVTTPACLQFRQALFSRRVTVTNSLAGSTSSRSLSSYPMTTVSAPHCPHWHSAAEQATIRSTRGRSAGSDCRPGCFFRSLRGGGSGRGGGPLRQPPRRGIRLVRHRTAADTHRPDSRSGGRTSLAGAGAAFLRAASPAFRPTCAWLVPESVGLLRQLTRGRFGGANRPFKNHFQYTRLSNYTPLFS